MYVNVNIEDGTMEQGELWWSLRGTVRIDGVKWNLDAYASESDHGATYTLTQRGLDSSGVETIRRIELVTAMGVSEAYWGEVARQLDEKWESLGILGSEVLSRKGEKETEWQWENIEQEVYTIRAGRVVGGHVVPVVGSNLDTFGPEWARL